jgi:hypothetical protein
MIGQFGGEQQMCWRFERHSLLLRLKATTYIYVEVIYMSLEYIIPMLL